MIQSPNSERDNLGGDSLDAKQFDVILLNEKQWSYA